MNHTGNSSEELFQTISLIARKEQAKNKTTNTIVGTVLEHVKASDTYKVDYQGVEILTSSLGGVYKTGDSVFILLPNGTLDGNKFILGKTNSRESTLSQNENGLSNKTLQIIQDIINSFNDITSDNTVSPVEKQALLIQWSQIQKSYEEAIRLASDYADAVSIEELIKQYNIIRQDFFLILENMDQATEIDGQAFRERLGLYFKEETNVRVLVQEELRKELLYKITIQSSGGNVFKNGQIDTELNVIVFQGRKDLTFTIEPDKIVWKKIDGSGKEQPNWQATGKSLRITNGDIDVKQVFLAKVVVDGITVAQDTISIVDMNDVEPITLTLTTNQSVHQIYEINTDKLSPNYLELPLIIKASTIKAGKPLVGARYAWYQDDTLLSNSANFIIEGDTLKITGNILNTAKPFTKIRCKVSHASPDEGNLLLEDIKEVSLTYIETGENGEDSLYLTFDYPSGKIIKNGQKEALTINLVALLGSKNITDKLTKFKWFYQDSSVKNSSPNYDKDAGEGWSLIGASNNLGGNISGFNTKTLNVSDKAVAGSLTIKALVYYDKYIGIKTDTVMDANDPLNVVILGATNLKEGTATTLRAEAYQGTEKIEDLTGYTIEWTLSNQPPASKFRRVSYWPKYGEEIRVLWEEIPDNPEVYILCKIYEDQ